MSERPNGGQCLSRLMMYTVVDREAVASVVDTVAASVGGQKEAAKLFGVSQPFVSKLRSGRVGQMGESTYQGILHACQPKLATAFRGAVLSPDDATALRDALAEIDRLQEVLERAIGSLEVLKDAIGTLRRPT